MSNSIVLTDKIPNSKIPLSAYPTPPILIMKEYFSGELDSVTDDDIKKVIAAAAIIKQKLSGQDNFSSEEMAHIADAGVSAAKVAYKVGTGKLDPTSAADYLVEKTTARIVTIVDKSCEVLCEKAGQQIGKTLGSIFGPQGALLGAAIGGKVGKYAGKAVEEYIVPGIKKVASCAKKILHTACEGVKSVASTVWTGVKNVGSSFCDWLTS
jgi:hypothetical protein